MEREKKKVFPPLQRLQNVNPLMKFCFEHFARVKNKKDVLLETSIKQKSRLVPVTESLFMGPNLSFRSIFEQHLGHGGSRACFKPLGAVAMWITHFNVCLQIFPYCLSP